MMKIDWKTGLKGMAMGMAEVVPGVSGGTIALITGIYEKLIATIKSVDLSLLRSLGTGNWKEVGTRLDMSFLFYLLGGMGIGIVIGVLGITYLFEVYPEPLWGFFFGLILASCVFVAKQIEEWNWRRWLALIIGAIVAFGITLISPVDGSDSLLYAFISGMVAICALILPGISGSFILLLMGMYTVIIPAVRSIITDRDLESLTIVSVFAMGCLVGIVSFSRVMNFLFKNFKDLTLAVLIGFMLGSLNKIWPWRIPTQILDKEAGSIHSVEVGFVFPLDFKILSEVNVIPTDYWLHTPKIGWTLFSFFLGLGIIFIGERLVLGLGNQKMNR